MDPTMKPMLCGKADVPPEGGEWVAEGKLDGWRVIAHHRDAQTATGGAIDLWAGRNSSPYHDKLPYLTEQLRVLLPGDTVVDGELIGARGWGDVQSVMTGGGVHRPTAGLPALNYVVFDLLRVAGTDARRQTWEQRRSLLERLDFDSQPNIMLSPAGPSSMDALDQMLDVGLEGLVCKRKDSIYVNTRSSLWIKVKPQTTDEARVVGGKPGEAGGRLDGLIGAFEVVMLNDDGSDGAATTVKCGTDQLHADATTYDPNSNVPQLAPHWLGRIIEVKHHGINPDSGVPRHPQFLRVRDDRQLNEDVRRAAAKVGVATKPRKAPKPAPSRAGGYSGRNYGAMKIAKLERSIAELEQREGEAYEKVLAKGAEVEADLEVARAALRSNTEASA